MACRRSGVQFSLAPQTLKAGHPNRVVRFFVFPCSRGTAVRPARGTCRRRATGSWWPAPSCQRPLPSDVAISAERRHALHRAVELLPERYRRVVRMRNFQLLTFQQIGDELQCSADAARKLWARAIEKLSQELDDDDSSARISS